MSRTHSEIPRGHDGIRFSDSDAVDYCLNRHQHHTTQEYQRTDHSCFHCHYSDRVLAYRRTAERCLKTDVTALFRLQLVLFAIGVPPFT